MDDVASGAVALEVNGPVLARAAEPLANGARRCARALDQHLQVAPDGLAVAPERARELERLHLFQAPQPDLARHFRPGRILHRRGPLLLQLERGRRVGTLAVEEAEEVVVGNAAQERKRLRVLGLRLAWKAADDVAGQRDVWTGLEERAHPRFVLRDGVPPPHAREHGIGPMLHGQVEVRHQLRDVAEALDQFSGQVHRMAGGETDPGKAGHGSDAANERRERAPSGVGVDVLADERDLADADADEGVDLADDLRVGTRDLATARVRDDAKRADVVAALHREDERGDPAAARLRIRLREDVLLARDPAGLDPALLGEIADAGELVGTEHEIHVGGAGEKRFLFLLRHAAGDSDTGAAGGLEQPVPPERRVQLVLGLLPDRAGIEQDEIGAFRRRGRNPASPRQRFAHPGRIVLVHLAAERVDVERFLHGSCRDLSEKVRAVNANGTGLP